MMKVLVTYATNSGSTAEVAQAIAEELEKNGLQAEARRFEEAGPLDSYDAVVVGAPMILGWHRSAVKFLKKNQTVLASKPVACFATAMTLTRPEDSGDSIEGAFIDPWLVHEARTPGRLSFKERYARLSHYAEPMQKTIRPVSMGFFCGKMEFMRMKFWQAAFVLLVIQAQPGDYRNWARIREWAAGLPVLFQPA